MAINPTKTASNPRIAKLIELEVAGRIKPEHQQELDTYRAQGMAPARASAGGTEGERKGSAFLTRAVGANRSYEATKVGPRGMLAQSFNDSFPNAANTFVNDGDRQVADSAQDEFIAASLRQDSGAAIPPDELDRQRRIYFPMPGDEPATIKQKRQARLRAISGLENAAGGSLSETQRTALAPMKDDINQAVTGEVQFNDESAPKSANSYRLSPENERSFLALAQAGASQEQLAAYAHSIGAGADPENLRQVADFYRDPAHRKLATRVDYSKVDEIKPVQVKGEGTTAAAVRGLADTVTLGALPRLGAIVDTVATGGTYADNLDRNRGIIANDEQQHPLARIAGQVAGGFALPTFGASSAGELARVGAGYGGAYGFLSSDQDLTSGSGLARATGDAGMQALIGAGAGYGAGRVGNRLAGRTGGGRDANPISEAAQRQGVPVTVPDIVPGTRSTYGFLESLPGSGGAVRGAVERGNTAMERRVGEIGGGRVADRADLGQTIQGAGMRFIGRSRTVRDRLYDRAEQLAGGQQITPSNALRTLDDQIADLSRTPEANAAKLNVLTRFRTDMVDDNGVARPLDLDSLRNLRTSMRDELNANNLRATDAERRVNLTLDAATQDINAQLTGGALRAYRRADTFNRRRSTMIDEVVQKFIGKRAAPMSGEQTVGRLEAMSRPASGDSARLARMINVLEPDEQSQVAGSIASHLGRRGADGENVFSSAHFFSDIQKFSPGARAAIWGQQGAADLADLARIAEGRGAVMARMNNSRSGQVSNWFTTLRSLMAGGGVGAGLGMAVGVGASAGVGATGAALTASYLTARMLGSRRVVTALGSAARANTPQARQQVVRRLAAIASREPALRADIIPVQRILSATIDGAPPALAANEREPDRQPR